MNASNIFIICPNCLKNTTVDLNNFIKTTSIKCPDCGEHITAGKDGVNQQLKHYIKDKKFNNAIYMHKVVTGDSLSKSKQYIESLSKSMGIKMKNNLGYKTLFIFAIIMGLVLTYIVSYFFYPKFVYIIANDLFGMKTRGINMSSYLVASVFYGVLIFVLLLFRRIIKKSKEPKVPQETAVPEQIKPVEQIKMPDQKDFRGNAF